MLKLRRLRIDQFRNVRPGTSLRFDDGLNVLLGVNGTGKTTLLALLSAIFRDDFGEFAYEPLVLEYVVVADEGPGRLDLTVRVTQRRPQQLEPRLANGKGPKRVRYDLEFEARSEVDGQEVVIRGDALDVSVLESNVDVGRMRRHWPGPRASIGILAVAEGRAGALAMRLHDFVSTSFSCYRLDESLELFHAITGGAPVSESMASPPALALDLVARPDGSRGVEFAGVMPLFLPDAMIGALDGEPTSLVLDSQSGAPPFLGDAARVLGFVRSECKTDVLEVEADGRRHLGPLKFGFWRADGSYLSHERLSYGQKRMLSFLYYVAANPDFVIADEVVNGLHHAWVHQVLLRLAPVECEPGGGRPVQAFLSSQNPVLIDELPIRSEEQIGRMFVLCRVVRADGGAEQLCWSNPSAAEARALHQDLSVGIEHVSQILRRMELW